MVKVSRTGKHFGKMHGVVKDAFRRSGFGFMLFLWFILVGSNGYSAETSASASASIASPASVNDAVADFWGESLVNEAIAGRLIIRIGGAGLLGEAGGNHADTKDYLALVRNSRVARFTMADFIKRITGERILSGATIGALTVSAADVTGFVIVTVAYN